MVGRLFVIERYEPSSDAPVELASLPAGSPARLILAVHLPADDVVLAVIEGPDEESVVTATAAARWRVDRLCPANWVVGPPKDVDPQGISAPPRD